MKRTLTLLISLLLLVSLLIPAAGAEETVLVNDSTYVNDAIRYHIGLSENAVALRIFEVSMLTFSESADIYDVLPKKWRSGGIIATSEDGKTFEFWTRSEYVPAYFSRKLTVNYDALHFYLNSDLKSYLGEDTVVNSVYYLNSVNTGTAIYYSTNKGNYVYFNHKDIEPCLFSAEVFHDYIQLVRAIHAEDRGYINYDALRFDVCYLSPYELDSPFFNPNAKHIIPQVSELLWFILTVSSLAVIAIVIVILVVLYRKKIKPHNPYEYTQGAKFDTDFVIYHAINDPVDTAENLPLTPN